MRILFLLSYVAFPLLLVGVFYLKKWYRRLGLVYLMVFLMGCVGFPELVLWLNPPPEDMKCGMPVAMLYMAHWFFLTPCMLLLVAACHLFWHKERTKPKAAPTK